MKKSISFFRLARPANIVTAIADILAGFSIVLAAQKLNYNTEIDYHDLLFLVLATIGLYGGGVVMNDVADYELDKKERPERPLPSGIVSRTSAAIWGILLLCLGVFCAFHVSTESGIISITIALLALLYDFYGKHQTVFGPINMGLCRGGNLLLGISASFSLVKENYFLAIIPIIYIAAITMISRGEVVGGNKKAIGYASYMYAFVIGALTCVSVFKTTHFYETIPFIALFSFLIYRPLIIAFKNPEPLTIRTAVKAGVLSLIVMDAWLSTCYMGILYGLIVLALLPVSILLAKAFAVT